MRTLINLFLLACFALSVRADVTVVVGQKIATAGGGGLVLYTTNKMNSTSGTAFNTGSITLPANSQLVVTACSERTAANNTFTVTDTSTLTWTRRTESTLSAAGDVEVFEAFFAAGGSITVTVTASVSGLHRSAVLWVVTGSETTWAGTTATSGSTAQSAPSVAITTTRADSFVIGATSDFNAVAGSATYRTPPTHTEIYVDPNGSNYRAWHYYAPVTTATSYTMGISTPTGQAAGSSFIEIRKP